MKKRKFITNILVRNNRLEILKNKGIKVNYELLSDENYVMELKKKLLEYAEDVLEADSIDDLKDEIVDVLEVIEHLISFYDFDEKELKQIKEEKQTKIGKFNKKIKIHSIELPCDHKDVEYYLSKPNKYQELKE